MKKKSFIVITITVILMFFSFVTAKATFKEPLVKKIYTLYKTGNYPKAINEIEKFNKLVDCWATAYYLKGLCHKKLQQHEKAITSFEQAGKCKATPFDTDYNLAQSLYATNDLEKSSKMFKQSIENNKQIATSHYYIASIAQIMEEYPEAEKHYNKINELELQDNISLIQVTNFELGKVYLAQAETQKKPAEYVNDIVIPQMEKAYEIYEGSLLATNIMSEVNRLEKKYDTTPIEFENGKPIPKKKYKFRFSEELMNDSNVTLQSDDASNESQAADKSAIASTTKFSGEYKFIVQKKYSINPGLKLSYSEYMNDSTPEIYQNDSYSINPYVKNTWEHMARGEKATFYFDINYNDFSKDYERTKTKKHYSTSITVGVGEKLNFFKYGDTTFRLKRKQVSVYTESMDTDTNTLNISQVMKLPNKQLVLAIFNFDNTTGEISSSDTNAYMFRGDYIKPDAYKGFKLHGALATTFTDTKEQSDTRGMEITINPSIKASRRFYQICDLSLKYDFTKKTSDLDSYAYTKHLITLGLDIRI